MRSLPLFVYAILLVSGCTTNRPGNEAAGSFYSGSTHADSVLRSDATKTLKAIVAARGCATIDHIDTAVISYEPKNGQKGHVWGKEGWMITACGKPFPYAVEFTEDGKGGTFFALTPVQR